MELTGFATEVRQGLRFNAGQNVVLNFSMKLSTVQETITVAGDAPIVQSTSSEVASTIDQKAFETRASASRVSTSYTYSSAEDTVGPRLDFWRGAWPVAVRCSADGG